MTANVHARIYRHHYYQGSRARHARIRRERIAYQAMLRRRWRREERAAA